MVDLKNCTAIFYSSCCIKIPSNVSRSFPVFWFHIMIPLFQCGFAIGMFLIKSSDWAPIVNVHATNKRKSNQFGYFFNEIFYVWNGNVYGPGYSSRYASESGLAPANTLRAWSLSRLYIGATIPIAFSSTAAIHIVQALPNGRQAHFPPTFKACQ